VRRKNIYSALCLCCWCASKCNIIRTPKKFLDFFYIFFYIFCSTKKRVMCRRTRSKQEEACSVLAGGPKILPLSLINTHAHTHFFFFLSLSLINTHAHTHFFFFLSLSLSHINTHAENAISFL